MIGGVGWEGSGWGCDGLLGFGVEGVPLDGSDGAVPAGMAADPDEGSWLPFCC